LGQQRVEPLGGTGQTLGNCIALLASLLQLLHQQGMVVQQLGMPLQQALDALGNLVYLGLG
jgi:hypothetical protein